MIRELIKIDIDQIVQIEEHQIEVKVSMDKVIEEDHIMTITIEMNIEEAILEICKIIEVNIIEVDTEGIIEVIIMEEVEVCLETDNVRRNDRSSSRSRSGSKANTNRDRIRCYKYREYDYFAKDCPPSQIEKESEQIQQMDNIDKEQAALKA